MTKLSHRFSSFSSLYIAWIISLAGTALSLFFSEVEQLEICRLCWFQRIALFPLTVQLGIASYRSDFQFAIYAYPLCIGGFCIALLQALQPTLGLSNLCKVGASCTENEPLLWGHISLSWLSTAGFALIAFLLYFTTHQNKK